MDIVSWIHKRDLLFEVNLSRYVANVTFHLRDVSRRAHPRLVSTRPLRLGRTNGGQKASRRSSASVVG